MRIKCIFNDIQKLKGAVKERLLTSIHAEKADENLVIGNTYTVMALNQWRDGGIRAYLHTVKGSDFPYPYPIEMFEVIDSSLPPD